MEICNKHNIELRNRKDKKGKYCPICAGLEIKKRTGRGRYIRRK